MFRQLLDFRRIFRQAMEPNIKFCEPTYTWSTSVAEFWNTMSSFVYCVPGLYYSFKLKSFRNAYPKYFTSRVCQRYALSYIAWMLLGFGSATFHATQSFWGELLDESAMLLASWSTCMSLRGMYPYTTGVRGIYFYTAYTVIMVIGMITYITLGSFPVFEYTFILSILMSVMLVGLRPAKVDYRKFIVSSGSILTNSVMKQREINTITVANAARLGAIVSLLGYAVWHVDRACVQNAWEPPSLYDYTLEWHYWAHPLWHVLTSCGVFLFLHATAQDRIEIALFWEVTQNIGTSKVNQHSRRRQSS